MQSDRLLTPSEAAEFLGLRLATLARWRWAGQGPGFVKLGGAVRYDPVILAAWLDAQRRTSTSDPGVQP
jgi:predicted DNA-binding transcriptional regulator AlpA